MKTASNSNYMVWAALLHRLWKGSVLYWNRNFGELEYFGRSEENIINPLSPSGHYMYRTVVTICTARWSLYVPPVSHSAILRSAHAAVFMCLVWISEQTAIISLYSINSLVCITERKCVYCAVRTGSLNVLEVNPEQSVCCSCAVFRHWIHQNFHVVLQFVEYKLIVSVKHNTLKSVVRPVLLVSVQRTDIRH